MKELIRKIELIEHMNPDSLVSLERIVELIYMSEQDELKGVKNAIREFDFLNCKVKVFYGK